MKHKTKLFLIDAHALCYRSYFAIKGLSTSYGQSTNAVYGFINTVRKILKEHDPEYIAICFDSGKKTHRQEKFNEYKIHRPRMPDELVSQIPIIKEVVSAYNLAVFEMEGFEADDLIATLAKKASQKDLEVMIVSDDKDMFQLVNDQVKVFSSRKDVILDREEVRKYLGVEPDKVADYIGLAGDKVDNIPGVAGIGEVTARNLINEFGSVEDIIRNLEQISSAKLREKLVEQKESALLSKELAILDQGVPLGFQLTKLKVQQPDEEKLSQLFTKLEFRRLAAEFSKGNTKRDPVQMTMVTDRKAFKKLKSLIEKQKTFSFLLEMDRNPGENLCLRVWVCCGSNQIYGLPIEQVEEWKGFFLNTQVLKITHNLKESLRILSGYDCLLKGKSFDVMLAAYLLNPSRSQYDLKSLTVDYIQSLPADEEPVAQFVPCVHQMYKVLNGELKKKSLLKLFEEIEIPLAYVLSKMEATGVNLDEPFLQDMSRECAKKIGALLKSIYRHAGGEFNLNSPKQLSQVLFETLKLPVIKKTKTGFSTNESVLVRLMEKHPIIEQILEYRQLAKLKSTYIDALPKLINPNTSRVHASFDQTGTETGRLSSKNPNLQNIPIRTELGRQIRRAFIPYQKGHQLISADYSQIELRILAHLADDKVLMNAFKKDEDIHTTTAALIFDVKEKGVSPHMRNTAKRINFGIIYGMSAFGLAKDLNISQEEAQEFIDKYLIKYPNVKKFMDQQIKQAQEKGYVLTILKRRRDIPEINSDHAAVQQFAQRQAINTPVQGSAADLMKLAMVKIHQEMETRDLKSRMLISVHDELVFNVVPEEKQELIALIREKMEHSMSLKVPIKVMIKFGKNWLDTQKV